MYMYISEPYGLTCTCSKRLSWLDLIESVRFLMDNICLHVYGNIIYVLVHIHTLDTVSHINSNILLGWIQFLNNLLYFFSLE